MRQGSLQVLSSFIPRRLLHGTVPYHVRAAYVATRQPPEEWPARAEDIPAFSPLLKAFGKTSPTKAVLFHAGSAYEEGDVLVFPERLLFPKGALQHPEALAQELLNTPQCQLSKEPKGGVPRKPIEKNVHYIFVCCHGARDPRCRECGTPVLKALQRWACQRSIPYQPMDPAGNNPFPFLPKPETYRVFAASHFGGHKHAANVILHGNGDWYGKVPPNEAVDLVQRYFMNGGKIEPQDCDMWRGRMGLTQEQQQEVADRLTFQRDVEMAGVWDARRWHEHENPYEIAILLE